MQVPNASVSRDWMEGDSVVCEYNKALGLAIALALLPALSSYDGNPGSNARHHLVISSRPKSYNNAHY